MMELTNAVAGVRVVVSWWLDNTENMFSAERHWKAEILNF
jgi:hypothetical protein